MVVVYANAAASLSVYECDRDGPRVALPRPEIQPVVRFGASARGGVDLHARGVGMTVHRKLILGGQRSVTARLPLGVSEAVLGTPASALVGRVVAIEELWADGATRYLFDRLAGARDTVDAAAILESAIAERLAISDGRRARARFTEDAADRLTHSSVNAVAADLGVSERHLRRVFHEAVGVSPKAFAKLRRFNRALRAARARSNGHVGWASIAAGAGYYDQAHLIAHRRFRDAPGPSDDPRRGC
jgi:AraC-like DNA-binding protein